MKIIPSKLIEKVMSPRVWTDEMELALLSSKKPDYFTPDRLHVDMGENTLLVMPSVGPEFFSTKLVSVFPQNKEKSKPIISGSMLLNSATTGETMALLNGAKITAMRTAAVASVGIRHLAKIDSKSIGIIGSGVQGRHIAWFACFERDIDTIYLLDSTSDSLKETIKFLEELSSTTELFICNSTEELIKKSDIIVTATSSSTPVIPESKELLEGKCIISVGSYKPEMRELPSVIYSMVDKVWIDAERGHEESGDIIYPIEKNLKKCEEIKHIGELLSGASKSESNTTLFKTVGLATFDLFASSLIYRKLQDSTLVEDITL